MENGKWRMEDEGFGVLPVSDSEKVTVDLFTFTCGGEA
jgi:hypothetical protein